MSYTVVIEMTTLLIDLSQEKSSELKTLKERLRKFQNIHQDRLSTTTQREKAKIDEEQKKLEAFEKKLKAKEAVLRKSQKEIENSVKEFGETRNAVMEESKGEFEKWSAKVWAKYRGARGKFFKGRREEKSKYSTTKVLFYPCDFQHCIIFRLSCSTFFDLS